MNCKLCGYPTVIIQFYLVYVYVKVVENRCQLLSTMIKLAYKTDTLYFSLFHINIKLNKIDYLPVG